MESSLALSECLQKLQHSGSETYHDVPSYWNNDPNTLLSTASIHRLAFGTGHSIFANSLLPAIEGAEEEVIMVTCFWARSASLGKLAVTLLHLSEKAIQKKTKIRVRICFSSSSLFQKLLHTQSLQGHTYSQEECESKLGLPRASQLQGLDLEVKSIFLLPFSVMHPKFVIVDRTKVLLPSCNVSWENWFEGVLELSGQLTEQFVTFWSNFWASSIDQTTQLVTASKNSDQHIALPSEQDPAPLDSRSFTLSNTPCIFLPCPHHRNPKFALPWQDCPDPPPTPLNTFTLSALANSQTQIYMQTPNLTATPVLAALRAALKRGVNVTLLTSSRLMILEQVVTAGTTTSRCVRKLTDHHRELLEHYSNSNDRGSENADLEAGLAPATKPGDLRITFYNATPHLADPEREPVQSHVKVTVVDGEWVIFGSGNMDRASWFTSQELGVGFSSRALAEQVLGSLGRLVGQGNGAGRGECVYDSRAVG